MINLHLPNDDNDLVFYLPFNIILSLIQCIWKSIKGSVTACSMKCRTVMSWISASNYIQTGTSWSGPSCSKLTTSLANDSLKFTSSDTQICWNFLLKKCHIFSAKHIWILYTESAKTVNKMTLNELVKLTTLWTLTGPWLGGLISRLLGRFSVAWIHVPISRANFYSPMFIEVLKFVK